MLWAVDDGKADLPNLVFDEIVFTDSVTTRAPMWSWDFLNVAGPNAAMYHDPKVAKLRKAMKWPALPETGGQ